MVRWQDGEKLINNDSDWVYCYQIYVHFDQFWVNVAWTMFAYLFLSLRWSALPQ